MPRERTVNLAHYVAQVIQADLTKYAENSITAARYTGAPAPTLLA